MSVPAVTISLRGRSGRWTLGMCRSGAGEFAKCVALKMRVKEWQAGPEPWAMPTKPAGAVSGIQGGEVVHGDTASREEFAFG